MGEPNWEEMKRLLDVIVLLMLESGTEPATSTTRKIEKLLELGLTQAEVARIIGKKPNYVSAVMSVKHSRSLKKERK